MAGETKIFGEKGEFDDLAQMIWEFVQGTGSPIGLDPLRFAEAFMDGHPSPGLDEALVRTWPGPGAMPIGQTLRITVVHFEDVVLG
jgi:hypothetical protein